MKIAMISYHTCPRASAEGKETGGMNVYVLELSRALVSQGHSVDIFTRSHEINDPLIIEEENNLRILHIPAGPQAVLPKKRLVSYIPDFIKKAESLVRSEKGIYDVMHAHYYQSGLVAEKVLSKYKNIPFVMSFHTLGLMKNLVARDTLEHESQTRILTEFRLMKRADAIIASSENDKEYMQYLYDASESKIHVIYPGINTSVFHPMDKQSARNHIGAANEHKIVLFVGRIEPLKGIDTLLYAMKILKNKNQSQTVCLWIVGGDTSEPSEHWPKTLRELTVLRKTLGIPESSVHFVGRQPQTELPYFYNAADVVVMPSHYESFGMTALEAMGSGTPVIVTNVAGISSKVDVKHISHVATVNNPLLLASQIDHVLSDRPHAKAVADKAKRSVSGLTWDHAAREVVSVYKNIK